MILHDRSLQPAVHPACRKIIHGVSLDLLSENESRYFARTCLALYSRKNSNQEGQTPRRERERGSFFGESKPPIAPPRTAQGAPGDVYEIEGDARSRYLLPCEIERRPCGFWE